MSHFSYGEHSKKRIGVWIKCYMGNFDLNQDVKEMIKQTKNKRCFDIVQRVVVTEYDNETKEVWLQVWCKNLIDTIRKKHRYNVFYIKTKPNKDWVCEGDLGAGFKE